MNNDDLRPPARGFGRRKALKAAVWTAPAITAITAAPAFASTTGAPTIAVGTAGRTGTSGGSRPAMLNAGNYYYWAGGSSYTTSASNALSWETGYAMNVSMTGLNPGAASGTATLQILVEDESPLGAPAHAKPVTGWNFVSASRSGIGAPVTLTFNAAFTAGHLPDFAVTLVLPGIFTAINMYSWSGYSTGNIVATMTAGGESVSKTLVIS